MEGKAKSLHERGNVPFRNPDHGVVLWQRSTNGVGMRYLQYLAAVLRKTVQPMQGLAETALLLVSLALPAVAMLAGFEMPSEDNVFAYLGMALVALIILRVFFVAPYQVWLEQGQEIDKQKAELEKPERLELAHMATIRAEKRLAMAALIYEFHWLSFTEFDPAKSTINSLYGKALTLMGQAGMPLDFSRAFARFTSECGKMNRAKSKGEKSGPAGIASYNLAELLTRFLHGRASNDELVAALAEHDKQEELPLDEPNQKLAK